MTETQSIQTVQTEIAEEFGIFDDWTERFQYIIELGQKAPPVPEDLQTEEYQVQGCQSKVWLIPAFKEGRLFFQAGSNAFISGGLVSLAVRVYSGHTPDEIWTTVPVFIDKIGMDGNITPSRLNGLRAVIKKIKMYALAYKAIQERQN